MISVVSSLGLCALPAACAGAPGAGPTRDAPLSNYNSPMGRTNLKDCLLAGAESRGVSGAKAVETPQGYRVGLSPDGAVFALIEGAEAEADLRYYRPPAAV